MNTTPVSMMSATVRATIFQRICDYMYDRPVYTQFSIEGKDSFHDLDLYIHEDSLKPLIHGFGVLYDVVEKRNPNKKTTILTIIDREAGAAYSVEIQTFESNRAAQFAARYHSFGGVGLLLGFRAHTVYGLTLSDTGLYSRVELRSGVKKVLITDNFGEALCIIGFDNSSWQRDPLEGDGMKLEDIYRFLESGDAHDPRDWIIQNLPRGIRDAVPKRPLISGWLTHNGKNISIVPSTVQDAPYAEPKPWFQNHPHLGMRAVGEITREKMHDNAQTEFKTWLSPEYVANRVAGVDYDSYFMSYAKRAFRKMLDEYHTSQLQEEVARMRGIPGYHKFKIGVVHRQALMLEMQELADHING